MARLDYFTPRKPDRTSLLAVVTPVLSIVSGPMASEARWVLVAGRFSPATRYALGALIVLGTAGVAACVAAVAWRRIRRSKGELGGERAAIAGLGIALAWCVYLLVGIAVEG